jgi:hypothetical protein
MAQTHDVHTNTSAIKHTCNSYSTVAVSHLRCISSIVPSDMHGGLRARKGGDDAGMDDDDDNDDDDIDTVNGSVSYVE